MMKVPAFLLLIVSALAEAGWNIMLKKSAGIADWRPNLLGGALLAIGIFTFKKALSAMPLSVAIVIWSGISLMMTIIFDRLFYKTRLDIKTAMAAACCIISILCLQYFSARNNPH